MRCIRTAGLLALATSAAMAAEPRFVHGSWVNVRATATADGAVVAHLSTNTPVQWLREEGRFCEIGFGAGQRGFVACALLGLQPLRIEQVNAPTDGQGRENPAYSPLRAFWIAPSVPRLLEAGEHFRLTLLSAEQRQAEEQAAGPSERDAPRLVRYPVPEFEAMKDLLRRGVVAGAENLAPRTEWSAALKAGDPMLSSLPEALTSALPLARPRGPSLFRNQADIEAPDATPEQLSARFRVPEHLRVLRGPRWGVTSGREFSTRYSGAWDIGVYESWLARPVVEHALARDGRLGGGETTLRRTVDLAEDDNVCVAGHPRPRIDQPLRGRPHVKEPLLLFYTPAPLAAMKVRVRTSTRELPERTISVGGLEYKRVAAHLVDLDGDGIDDLAVVEGAGIGSLGGEGPLFRLSLANIAGAWYGLAMEFFDECT